MYIFCDVFLDFNPCDVGFRRWTVAPGGHAENLEDVDDIVDGCWLLLVVDAFFHDHVKMMENDGWEYSIL